MSLCFKESLSKLEKLSPQRLHETSSRWRAGLGGAEWKLSLCLLASVRQKSFRDLGYSNVTEYAERGLQLSGKKAGQLLGIARALEHLPILSQAFQTGKICWSKLREIQTLATPETEALWLEFAMRCRSDQVAHKVALCPKEWKRQLALQASLDSAPIAEPEAVAEILWAPVPDKVERPSAVGAEGLRDAGLEDNPRRDPSLQPALEAATVAPGTAREAKEMPSIEPSEEPGPEGIAEGESSDHDGFARGIESILQGAPKCIRLVFDLTPDQFALYESAERRVKAQEGQRVKRAVILARMAESILNGGTARSRAKHQVLIHTSPYGDQAWYETQRGLLPVHPEVLRLAKDKKRAAIRVEDPCPGPCLGMDRHDPPSEGESKPADSGFENRGVSLSAVEPTSKASTIATAPLTGHSTPNACSVQAAQGGGCSTAKNFAETVHDGAPPQRKAVPNAMIRELFARAGHRCERCGDDAAILEAHHSPPVSEGGVNHLSMLGARCRSCHSMEHENDFATKLHWWTARQSALDEAHRRQTASGRHADNLEAFAKRRWPGRPTSKAGSLDDS